MGTKLCHGEEWVDTRTLEVDILMKKMPEELSQTVTDVAWKNCCHPQPDVDLTVHEAKVYYL